jgi:hypothetical protein
MKVRFLWIGMAVLFLAGVLTASSDAAIDPATAVGIWMFDEGAGETTTDSSANGNDGTLMENPQWVAGKFGQALEFDGTSFVDMGNAESLQFAGSVTIAFWVKSASVAAGRQNPVCKSYGGEGCLTIEPDGRMSFYWGDCGGNCQPYVEVARPAPGTFVDNEWIHVVEVRDVSKREYQLYKNGEVVATDGWAECGVHPCGDSAPSELNLLIGSGYAGKFIGIIDDVGIFNTVLSEDDIMNIMNNGLKGATVAVEPAGKLATTWARLKQ